ncbi:lysozyme inhibitor [Leptospira bouyouniensis]|uniref:Lysozyme inhibitor n=2 Tax=Leptospira bouyouniensis TaxID=2484911 RepID=A0ABY2L6F3_9LEPT|nr:lysozyme inhibitor [Leptospira bouyouniensis]
MKMFYRFNFIAKSSILTLICLFSLHCKPDYEEIEVVYLDQNGQKINAIYHNPFDETGTFSVTLKSPNGNSITLIQGMAASGVRYTDNKTLVWWTKGNEAFIMQPDRKGDWEITNRFIEIQHAENHR